MGKSDLRIDNAIIVDGTGASAFNATVTVDRGIIRLVDHPEPATRTIDAQGAVLAPGFIDLHTHTDFTLPRFPEASAMVRQGVTTHLTGNCGFSPFPNPVDRRSDLAAYSSFIDAGLPWDRWTTAAGYMTYLDSLPLATNVALQVGLGSVRVATMGFDQRKATEQETDIMADFVAEAFDAGVFGVSSGLVYPPGAFADAAEVTALVSVAHNYGGHYSTHIRNEAAHLLEAVAEAITTAEAAGVPLQLSHHKSLGERYWGLVHQSLSLIDEANHRGLDVTADQYPYRAGSTGFTQILPSWVLAGGTEAMQRAIASRDTRRRIVAALRATDSGTARDFNPEAILLSEIPEGPNRRYEGRYLSEIAAQRGEDPIDTALGLLADEGNSILMVVFGMSEADVRTVMTHPAVAIASDGWTLSPRAGGVPHPRSYGTYARVLGRYVREEGLLTLEQAIHKMTGLPARRLPGAGRGVIADGNVADLVLFDPDTVVDNATFEEPHQFCTGVSHVLVGGALVIDEGHETGATPGAVLRMNRRT
ncbi:MAG: D-aminoacylase [Actinomycetota bacterium]|nr:D-aminoacylase [Actinomycetota bacterium]